jgi:putative ABC transport system permease protein
MSWRDLPFVFRPVAQKPPETVSVIVRTADSAHALEAGVRRRIALIDIAVPVGDIETMTARVTHVLAYPRFRAVLLGTFAGLALLLAVVGLYGVVSQSVTQRTHEIGIRMALGAQKGDVLNMVIRQGLVLVGLGVMAGLLAAWLLTRLLAVLLYGVKADDAFVPAAASLTLFFAGFMAAYLPARRAAHIDPTVALRYE